MERIVGYCGVLCNECDGFKATQAGDMAALERAAATIREQYNAPDVTAENIMCDGCVGETGHKGGYCFMCGVRLCAVERDIETCADCADYGCDKVQDFWSHAPRAKATLEEIRASRGAL